MGAGLIILFSSPETIVGRFLGAKLIVGIGLISYSAYLWHQPIFAFARHRSLTIPDGSTFSVLISLTFLLAFLSWRYVERPFRNKGVVSLNAIFIFALMGSATFIAMGIAGYASDGFDESRRHF